MNGTEISQDTPRIYVASLSDYNAGLLYGAWIDATLDADEIAEQVRAMLAASPEPGAEEWAIHDYDNFGGLRLGEWESFERVSELGQFIAEHDGAGVAYVENDSSASLADFEESYRGEFASLTDYAAEWIEESGMLAGVPETVATYFDYEAYARDLRLGGDVWTADSPNGVYVFVSL